MKYRVNSNIEQVSTPPIAQARSWLSPELFGEDTPLIDLSQAVPSYAPPGAITAALDVALTRHDTAFYTDITGKAVLREALAAHMSQGGGSVHLADVAITAGCNQAFCTVMQTLAAPGDNVVIPLPWYFNHSMWLDTLGVTARPIAFDEAAGGIPDSAAIEAAIDSNTRAIVLVTPNNPTGAVYAPEYLARVNAIARRKGVALVVDETYRDFLVDDDGNALSAHALFEDADWRESFIQLYSFSKAYSLTGYRVGSIIGAPSFIEQAQKVLDCVTICPTAIGQEAALAGLEHGANFVNEKRALMASRTAAIRAAFAQNSLRASLVSSGAYFAYMKHGFQKSSTEVARLLAREYNLLTLPGAMFGPGQESYLRVAFANVDESRFSDFSERLRHAENTYD